MASSPSPATASLLMLNRHLFSTCTIISQSGHSVTFELTGGIVLAGSGFFIDLSDDGDNMGAGKGAGKVNLKSHR